MLNSPGWAPQPQQPLAVRYEPTSAPTLDELPFELAAQIFASCDAKSLVRVSAVSSSLRESARDGALWRALCAHDWALCTGVPSADWRAVYRCVAMSKANHYPSDGYCRLAPAQVLGDDARALYESADALRSRESSAFPGHALLDDDTCWSTPPGTAAGEVTLTAAVIEDAASGAGEQYALVWAATGRNARSGGLGGRGFNCQMRTVEVYAADSAGSANGEGAAPPGRRLGRLQFASPAHIEEVFFDGRQTRHSTIEEELEAKATFECTVLSRVAFRLKSAYNEDGLPPHVANFDARFLGIQGVALPGLASLLGGESNAWPVPLPGEGLTMDDLAMDEEPSGSASSVPTTVGN